MSPAVRAVYHLLEVSIEPLELNARLQPLLSSHRPVDLDGDHPTTGPRHRTFGLSLIARARHNPPRSPLLSRPIPRAAVSVRGGPETP